MYLQAKQRLTANAILDELRQFDKHQLAVVLQRINAATLWLSSQGLESKPLKLTVSNENWSPAVDGMTWLSKFVPQTIKFDRLFRIERAEDYKPQRGLVIQTARSLDTWVSKIRYPLEDHHVVLCIKNPNIVFSWFTMRALELPGAALRESHLDHLVIALKRLAKQASTLPPYTTIVAYEDRQIEVDVLPPRSP
jgi:hypothetical protein